MDPCGDTNQIREVVIRNGLVFVWSVVLIGCDSGMGKYYKGGREAHGKRDICEGGDPITPFG